MNTQTSKRRNVRRNTTRESSSILFNALHPKILRFAFHVTLYKCTRLVSRSITRAGGGVWLTFPFCLNKKQRQEPLDVESGTWVLSSVARRAHVRVLRARYDNTSSGRNDDCWRVRVSALVEEKSSLSFRRETGYLRDLGGAINRRRHIFSKTRGCVSPLRYQIPPWDLTFGDNVRPRGLYFVNLIRALDLQASLRAFFCFRKSILTKNRCLSWFSEDPVRRRCFRPPLGIIKRFSTIY